MDHYDRRADGIRSLARQLAEASDRDALRRRLADLLDLLPVHFEAGDVPHGLLDRARDAAPLRSMEVDRLMREHGDLLRRLRRLSERITAEPDPPSAAAQDEARALAALLVEHEERASRLLAVVR